MNYDGTTKIGDALAKLYGFSPKSANKVAKVMSEARAALKLGNAKRLTLEQNLAIYEYHLKKVNGMNIPTDNGMNTHTESIETDMNIPAQQDCKMTISPLQDVNIPTSSLPTNDVKYPTSSVSGDVSIHTGIIDMNNPTPEPCNLIDSVPQKSAEQTSQSIPDNAFTLINFSIKLSNRRTVISLEQYFVEALKAKFNLLSNTDIRQWLEALPLDAKQPITRQIKYWIVQRVIND